MSHCTAIILMSSSQKGQSALVLEHITFDKITLYQVSKECEILRWSTWG